MQYLYNNILKSRIYWNWKETRTVLNGQHDEDDHVTTVPEASTEKVLRGLFTAFSPDSLMPDVNLKNIIFLL